METIIFDNKDFKLKDTFECGQCFRWECEDGAYIGVAYGRCARIREEGDKIILESSGDGNESFWRKYLDLDRDYAQIKKSVGINELMKEACEYGGGIRLLKQEFFETLLSYIISQRSSIPKIKSTVRKICEKYGDEIEFEGRTFYSFPSCEVLSGLTEEDFRTFGTGYRAPYLYRAVQAVYTNAINAYDLMNISTEEARKKLLTMYGVGDKVCDCILLFALGKYDLFPSDVWIKRVMAESFNVCENEAKGEGEKLFGQLSGFAQQYLFYYRRNGIK